MQEFKKQQRINPNTLLKSLHFFAAAGNVPAYLYCNLFYFNYLHLSKSEVGFLAGITPAVSLIVIPVTLYMAERSNTFTLKRTLMLCIGFGASVWSLHLLVPVKSAYTIPMLVFIRVLSAASLSTTRFAVA